MASSSPKQRRLAQNSTSMFQNANHYDSIILGGGVIGLSLAWRLAQEGNKVCVVDRGPIGKEASWAGAGMVPAGPNPSLWPQASTYEQLEGLSQQLHPKWHQELYELTRIDTQYQQCGTLHLAADPLQDDSLQKKVARWLEMGIQCDALDAHQIAELEPALAQQAGKFCSGYFVPEEAQFRSPLYLKALGAACQIENVQWLTGVQVEQFETSGDMLNSVQTDCGPIHADRFCLATGCWSGQIAQQLGFELKVHPIRGQIVLLNGPPGLFRHNVYVGMHYFTPRLDGRLLVGSTLEKAGFHKTTTPQGIAELMDFAASFAPSTAKLPVKKRWAGLRPGTVDKLPYLGPIPHLKNAWLATGHYRAGLQLSPATAVVMGCLLQEKNPPIDVSPLSITRSIDSPAN